MYSPKKLIFGLVLVSAFSFTLGYQIASDGYSFNRAASILPFQNADANEKRLDLDRFWRVLSLIDENYLRQEGVNDKDLIDGAIGGMVESLGDPYSYYLSTDETTSFQDGLDGKYEGVGVQLGYKNDQLVIIAPLDGGPAKTAGIQAGDIIGAVDGTSIENMNFGEVVSRIRGEQGTTVVLTIARRNTEGKADIFDVSIVRDEIDAPNMLLNWEEGNIAYVNLLRFGTGIDKEWGLLEREMIDKNVAGVVIDVRDNPGGFLDGAVTIASSFTDKGLIVGERYADGTVDEFNSKSEGALQGVPIVIVMNESSASASEILAGALRQRANATIVGVKSFGKNTVQKAYSLDAGSSVHVTVANWVLPNGEIIPDDGLTPDIEVKADTATKEDEQKIRALEVVKNEQ